MSTTSYDVVVVGGGMVGAVTALLFAQQGHAVTVLESQQPTGYPAADQRQLRVSAISKHNLDLLAQLGISQHWPTERVGHYRDMQVWDNHSTGEIEFGGGRSIMGAMIENDLIVAAAQQLLADQPQVQVLYNTRVDSFDMTARKVQLQLSDGANVQSKLLVGADGARSAVRTKLGISTQRQPYQQHGLVCYIKLEQAPEETALQAFNDGGPVGLLPMNDGLFSVVWSLPDAQLERWLHADEAQFINGLQAHINRDFGRMTLCSERRAFPLAKAHATSFYQQRAVLIGDAAHTIHPLAGQGVNLGFADAECLVGKVTQDTLKQPLMLARALQKYQRERMAEAHKTAGTMHALHHLFTNQSAPVKMLRAFGMNRLNQIQPIKSWLLKQAGS